MNRCPLTYLVCEGKYSEKGLKFLSKNLKHLKDFPYTCSEQLRIAEETSDKLSIQGVQPKLSIKLDVKNEIFNLAETNGQYILKPPHDRFKEVPENEDVSMRLAELVGIETPLHGMIYNKDQTLSYFIKRFDREKNQKFSAEDFSQLLGQTREGKYQSSMEVIASVITKHCTFPSVEKLKLLKLTIFNYLIGNEDAHLKNFTLIRRDGKAELSPAYDLLNTTILMKVREELALTLNGKKNKLKRSDFIDYFGLKKLLLPQDIVEEVMETFKASADAWFDRIDSSFLSEEMKTKYKELIEIRRKILEL